MSADAAPPQPRVVSSAPKPQLEPPRPGVDGAGPALPVTAPARPDGHLDPVALHGLRAGFVTRAVASTLDLCAVVVLLILGWLAFAALIFLARPGSFSFPRPGTGLLVTIGTLLLAAYWTVAWATTGRSYGDAALGLRVVDVRGERTGWLVAGSRAVLSVAFPLGLLWVLVSSRNRSLQDVVLRTSTIYDWSEARPPEQTARPRR